MERGKRNIDRRWSPVTRKILRRRVVAMLVRGLEEHEIVQQLSVPTVPDGAGGVRSNPTYLENPSTGKPYDQSTINRLIHKIWDEWLAMDTETIRRYRMEIIQHNIELERVAWANHDLSEVRVILDQRAKLLGAFAPIKYSDVSDIEMETEARRLLEEELARRDQLMEQLRAQDTTEDGAETTRDSAETE